MITRGVGTALRERRRHRRARGSGAPSTSIHWAAGSDTLPPVYTHTHLHTASVSALPPSLSLSASLSLPLSPQISLRLPLSPSLSLSPSLLLSPLSPPLSLSLSPSLSLAPPSLSRTCIHKTVTLCPSPHHRRQQSSGIDAGTIGQPSPSAWMVYQLEKTIIQAVQYMICRMTEIVSEAVYDIQQTMQQQQLDGFNNAVQGVVQQERKRGE